MLASGRIGPVTRMEAEEVIRGIWQGPRELNRAKGHFAQSAGQRSFTMQDVNMILRSHRMEGAPEWKPKHRAFRVRLLGTCLEGRATRLVLDLRAEGPCTLVSIMENRQSG